MRNLGTISKNASRLLYKMSGFHIQAPKVIFSSKVKDAAWYSHGRIYLNPDHNPEKLEYDEMIAHEFFHHAQTRLHAAYAKSLWESSAMFFAAIYKNRTKKTKEQKEKIIKYLLRKEHTPVGGNGRILLKLKQNNYDVRKTLLNLLEKKKA